MHQLTSAQHNEIVQEAARLRSKLKSLDNLKKDELQRALEAKDQELLEYRAKLQVQQAPTAEPASSEHPLSALLSQLQPQMEPSAYSSLASRASELEVQLSYYKNRLSESQT